MLPITSLEASANPEIRSAVAWQIDFECRKPAGIPLLFPDHKLLYAAQAHAVDMARNGYFSHVDREGYWPAARIEAAGYRAGYTGEIIALGQTTPAQAVDSWMHSAGHRAAILDPRYTHFGIGMTSGKAVGPYPGIYWVVVFATPR